MEHPQTRSSKNYFAPRLWAARITALIALMLFLAPGISWARKKKPKPLPPEEAFAQKIAGLAAPLYPLHQDESGPIAGDIQKLVVEHMQEWLTQHPPSAKPGPTPYYVDVRRELESVFSAVRYPIYAWPATFAEPWKDHLLIGAGYTLGWRTFERVNVLALFDRSQGTVKLAAVTNFIPRVNQHFEFLPAPPSGDFRFLDYGTRLGKSHPRLSAELYSFDGQELKSLWKTEDVYDGKLEFENDRVTINYMKESEFVEAATYNRTPPRYLATYKVTPQGLELVSNEQIAAHNP